MDGLSVLPENQALLHARAQVQKELYSAGVNMIMSGKIGDALALTSDILKIHPKSAIAWMLRATSMQEIGQIQKALAAAQHAVYLAPNNPDARFILGFILSTIGQHDKAISEYIEMLQLAKDASPPDKAKMLDALASTYAAAGRLPEAITTAENALELATSAGQKEMAEAIRKQIQFFKAQQSPQQKR
jgi:tetratricopeptide (TPR) repeat protein